MVAHGRVQNGVVVLDNGVRLPEGQEVTVLAHGTVAPAPRIFEVALFDFPRSDRRAVLLGM
jgi:hypothetical protein